MQHEDSSADKPSASIKSEAFDPAKMARSFNYDKSMERNWIIVFALCLSVLILPLSDRVSSVYAQFQLTTANKKCDSSFLDTCIVIGVKDQKIDHAVVRPGVDNGKAMGLERIIELKVMEMLLILLSFGVMVFFFRYLSTKLSLTEREFEERGISQIRGFVHENAITVSNSSGDNVIAPQLKLGALLREERSKNFELSLSAIDRLSGVIVFRKRIIDSEFEAIQRERRKQRKLEKESTIFRQLVLAWFKKPADTVVLHDEVVEAPNYEELRASVRNADDSLEDVASHIDLFCSSFEEYLRKCVREGYESISNDDKSESEDLEKLVDESFNASVSKFGLKLPAVGDHKEGDSPQNAFINKTLQAPVTSIYNRWLRGLTDETNVYKDLSKNLYIDNSENRLSETVNKSIAFFQNLIDPVASKITVPERFPESTRNILDQLNPELDELEKLRMNRIKSNLEEFSVIGKKLGVLPNENGKDGILNGTRRLYRRVLALTFITSTVLYLVSTTPKTSENRSELAKATKAVKEVGDSFVGAYKDRLKNEEGIKQVEALINMRITDLSERIARIEEAGTDMQEDQPSSSEAAGAAAKADLEQRKKEIDNALAEIATDMRYKIDNHSDYLGEIYLGNLNRLERVISNKTAQVQTSLVSGLDELPIDVGEIVSNDVCGTDRDGQPDPFCITDFRGR